MSTVAVRFCARSGPSYSSSIARRSLANAGTRSRCWTKLTAPSLKQRSGALPEIQRSKFSCHLSNLRPVLESQRRQFVWAQVARRTEVTASAGGKMAASAGSLVASHGPDECIFCKIIRGEIPSYKLLETEHAVAFLDAFPMREGHVLLVPKKHAPFITDLSPEDAAESLKELPRVAQAVQKAYDAQGISIAQNNGAPAGQVVFHVHFHIFPREPKDGLLKWAHGSKTMLTPDDASRIQEKIKEHI